MTLRGDGGRQGGTPDFKWQEWSKDFFGFEIFDFGIFMVKKFLASIFWVAWFGYSKQSEDSW